MGRERWIRGGREGRERPFDWYTLAKERDIPLEQARALYEEASRRASESRGPHRNAEALYLELLEGARQEAVRPSPGKVTRTMRLAAERAGKRPRRRPAAPGKRTLTSYLEPPARERHNMDAVGHARRPAEGGNMAGTIQAAGLQGVPDEPVRLPGHGGGAELPDDVRREMEAAFGVDFSSVRIHEGAHAGAIGALAYTRGTDIHFAPGQYQPRSRRGQELLGHELAHVVQQSQGRVGTTAHASGMDINDDASLEREADEMGARAARGERSRGQSSGPIPTPAVVRGEPAQPLLDGYAARGAAATRSSGAVQMRWGDPDDQACAALRQFIDRVPPERIERTLRAWNQAVWTRRGPTVALPTNRAAITVPIDDAREAVRALQARMPSAPDSQAGESAQSGSEQPAQGGAPAQEQQPARSARDAGATETQPGGEVGPDPAWDTFAGQFRSEFADVLHAFGGGELDGQRLRQIFTVGQRDKLRQFAEDHMIPDRLFNSGDVARPPAQPHAVTAQQRLLLSGHILANGRYQRPEQEAERVETQRMEARSCGHWANMVNAYAGVSPEGSVGVEQSFDHSGNVVLGGATPTRPIDSRHARGEEQGAGRPNWRAASWSQLGDLQAGDWLYIYNGQGGAETSGQGGQHSVIFAQWIEQREDRAYWIAETFDQLHNRTADDDPNAQDNQGEYQGGARHQHRLGETYSQDDRIYPVTRIVRAGEHDHPADTPEQLLPETGRSERVATRNARILSRRGITLDDAMRWVRTENDTLITAIASSRRADGQSRLGDHERRVLQETNERSDLEILVRLNERLQGIRTGAAALDESDQRQTTRYYETSQGSVSQDDLQRPVGARATTGLVTNVERPLPRPSRG